MQQSIQFVILTQKLRNNGMNQSAIFVQMLSSIMCFIMASSSFQPCSLSNSSHICFEFKFQFSREPCAEELFSLPPVERRRFIGKLIKLIYSTALSSKDRRQTNQPSIIKSGKTVPPFVFSCALPFDATLLRFKRIKQHLRAFLIPESLKEHTTAVRVCDISNDSFIQILPITAYQSNSKFSAESSLKPYVIKS